MIDFGYVISDGSRWRDLRAIVGITAGHSRPDQHQLPRFG